MKTHSCRNCSNEFSGRYCPRCGQRNDIARLSWKTLFDGFMSIIFGKDYNGESGDIPRYGLFGTFWRILFHPATTVSEYFSGKRVRYFSPIGILFLLSALCVLISYWTGVKILEGQPETPGFEPFWEYGNTHPVIFSLLAAPVAALAYKWMFAKISALKYVEYLYMQIFLSTVDMTIDCVRIVFLSIFPTLEKISNPLFSGIGILILIGMSAAIFRSLLQISRLRAVVSTIIGKVISYILIFAVVSVIVFLYILISNP